MTSALPLLRFGGHSVAVECRESEISCAGRNLADAARATKDRDIH